MWDVNPYKEVEVTTRESDTVVVESGSRDIVETLSRGYTSEVLTFWR